MLALKQGLPMALLKRFFAKKSTYKSLKRDLHNARLAAILETNAIDLVIDVGANTGQSAEALRGSGYRGEIVSYEPIRRCHEELTAKAASDPRWSIAPRCALGDSDGTVELQVSQGSSLSSIAPPTPAMARAMPKVRAASSETVPIHRLDALMKDELKGAAGVFLKVDAQGHDMAVLRGAEGIMARLTGIKVEMSLLPLYEGETLYLEILQFLHERGFHPHMLIDVGYSEKLGRQLQIDGVFIKGA